jgi:hypothetical protein
MLAQRALLASRASLARGFRTSSASLAAVVRGKAPAFSAPALMPDGSFGTVRLEDYTKAGKYVVLFTYPLDFTFVCPTEVRRKGLWGGGREAWT